MNDVVGFLVLGAATQTAAGTYGSSASTATFRNDEYFSGAGVVTLLVPEPGSIGLLGLAAAGLLARRRRSRAR